MAVKLQAFVIIYVFSRSHLRQDALTTRKKRDEDCLRINKVIHLKLRAIFSKYHYEISDEEKEEEEEEIKRE